MNLGMIKEIFATFGIMPSFLLIMAILFYIKPLIKKVEGIGLTALRLQILNLIQHSPDQVIIIKNLYDKYHKKGGNSYIDDIYKEWESALK